MLKTYFFLVALQALNLQLCQKINSTTSIFQLKKFQRIEQQFLNSMYGMLLKVYRSSFPAVATCTFTWPMVDFLRIKYESLDGAAPTFKCNQ